MVSYVLVGGGFLGKYILRELLAIEDAHITIIDKAQPDIFFGHPMTKNYEKDERVKYLWQSLGDTVNLEKNKVLDNADGGIIFTSAIADVPYAESSPIDTYQTNVINTLQFFEALRAKKYNGRVIIMSSESIYGHQPEDKLPIDENCIPSPANIYGVSKLCQELTARLYYTAYNIRVTVLRSATMYGLYSRTKQAIPVFAQQILKDEPVSLMGDGKQSRDFISVLDVAQAAVKAVTAPTDKHIEGEIFNIGTGNEVALINLVNAMKMSLRKPSDEFDKEGGRKEGFVPINFYPWRPGEKGLRVVLNSAKARKELDWEPRVQLRDGLCNVLAWVGTDILKYEPDEIDLLHQILFPTKYTIDYSQLPADQKYSMRMSDDEFRRYKDEQFARLQSIGKKYRSQS
jgi:UDP-glucose 4-epimerase